MVLIYNPRQTILLTCKGKARHMGVEKELELVVPLNWHMPVSHEPPFYAVALSSKTLASEIIRESAVFVVNFVSDKLIDTIVSAGKKHDASPEDLGLEKADCEKIMDCFRLKNCLGYLECQLAQEREFGDHIVFIAKIVNADLLKDDKRPFHLDGDRFTTTKD